MSALYRASVVSIDGARAELLVRPLQLTDIANAEGFALLALLGAAVDPMPDALRGTLPRALASDPDELFGMLQDMDEGEGLEDAVERFVRAAAVETSADGGWRLSIDVADPTSLDHLAVGQAWDGYFVGR